MSELKSYRNRINSLLTRYHYARQRVKDETATLESAEQRVNDARQAQTILQEVAQSVQQQVHARIASVVSRCLEMVYDEPYTFDIIFERKRGKTDARLVFRRGDQEVDPTTAAGGGPVDVAAFALRLACLCLQSSRKLLVLDEPFRFLSADVAPRVRTMMEVLSRELGVQFVQVTHNPLLQAGKVVELG